MKHFFLLLTCFCLISFSSRAQVYPFSDGFETYSPLLSPAGLLGAGYQTDSFKIYNNTHAYVSTQCATIRVSTALSNDSLVTPVIGALTGSSMLTFYARSCSAFGPYPRQHFLRTGEYINVNAIDISTGTSTNLLRIDSTNQNTTGNYVRYTYLLGGMASANVRIKYDVFAVSTYFFDVDSITLMDTVVVLPPAFNLNPVVRNPLCSGGSDGSIHLYPSGGTSPYSYVWSDSLGTTNDSLAGLSPGNYTVTVTDSTGAVVIQTINISNTSGMTSTITTTRPLCPGDSNGTATIHVSGGTQPYSYVWNTGGADSTLTNLVANTYTVIVTDNNGCTITRTANVLAPRAMTLGFTTVNESAIGAADGSSRVRVTGGTPGFSYLWSPGGAITAINSNLTAGEYCVTVTDTNGCTVSGCDTITVALPIKLTEMMHIDVACFGDSSGAVRVRGINGNFPYTYNWSNGLIGANQFNLMAGLYEITITDNNGRTGIDTVIVTSPPALTATLNILPTSSSTTSTGSACVVPSGGTAPYTYSWTPGGEITSCITGLGVGTYTVVVTDSNGCMSTFTANILVSSINKNDIGSNVQIYPIPSNHNLFVELNNSTFMKYEIYDVNGRTLLSNNFNTLNKVQSIDLTVLVKGQYVIKISDKEGNSFNRKFIKE